MNLWYESELEKRRTKRREQYDQNTFISPNDRISLPVHLLSIVPPAGPLLVAEREPPPSPRTT